MLENFELGFFKNQEVCLPQ